MSGFKDLGMSKVKQSNLRALSRTTMLVPALSLLLSSCVNSDANLAENITSLTDQQRCSALGDAVAGKYQFHLASAEYLDAGPAQIPSNPFGPPSGPPPQLPGHCDVMGVAQERVGVDGQNYSIQFHLRLPSGWNGKFFMQGGGGTNGDIGDALGMMDGATPALAQGYAVLSEDSGHNNSVNSLPERGGASAFGLDPIARANYGGASLPVTVAAAKSIISDYYGNEAGRSYFVGCSKGGQEGMMAAQRYPGLFDGIIAGSPGMSLPRAAIAEAWDVQAFASVAVAKGEPVTLQSIAGSFSDGELGLVGQAVLRACDGDDGLVDGIIGNFPVCTSDKVIPQLEGLICDIGQVSGPDASCLSGAQITALTKVQSGPTDSAGNPLYSAFPWDAGWSDQGWRMWKIGASNGQIPSINVMMGMPSLATTFTTAPTISAPGIPGSLAYGMGFDFDVDGAKIYATDSIFARSAWQDIGARTSNLDAFSKAGGKLIVPHGVSDPVFSLFDTIAWWEELDQKSGGNAADTVRVFPVPGMAHCGGGPGTTGYDAFSALVDWVESDTAPDRINATALPGSPWPGRSRPLCPFPKIAHYRGAGDEDSADSFECR